MADKYNDDYQSQNEQLIKRESIKLERARARAESLEHNMTKGIAAALKASYKDLAREAGSAVQRSEGGNLSDTQRRMLDAARQGIDLVQIDEGIITGENERSRDYQDEE